jgi:arabinofuranan 3-O-arabinosyltransferase
MQVAEAAPAGRTGFSRVRGFVPPRLDTLIVALLAYVPFLYSEPGRISADTKAYLYLDPGRLLSSATSMWNPDQGFGFVTHQNVGYLFPMGPYFWITHTLGVPTWIAQRFWMGSLLFLAALGVRKACEEFGLSRQAGWVAALPYMLSPFILVNIGRTSALLMPWAGLGWLMLGTMRALRRKGWRDPALVAFVVALTGGINATSILLVGLGPLLWITQQGLTRHAPWRDVRRVLFRIGLLSTLVSLWWLGALWIEGKFGINILLYTESIATVSTTSSSAEVFRGLGYWYFYGLDHLQPWTQASGYYVSGLVLPALSFALPILGALGALIVKWRGRTFSAVLIFIGVVISVGSYPVTSPTPIGHLFRWFAEHTTLGLAMRSLNRVGPLIVLGLCLSLAASYDALRAFKPRWAHYGRIGVVALAILGLFPLFIGRALAPNLSSPSTPPNYVTAAARYLNGLDQSTAVFNLPGLNFGYYTYGTYGDSIWPGLLTRPYISDEVVLQGTTASVNLLRSLDETFQDGIATGESVAPIARLLHAGDILVSADGQFDRFSQPSPAYIQDVISSDHRGLTLLKSFGPQRTDKVRGQNFIDEYTLSLPTSYKWPRALTVYRVNNPLPLVRTETPKNPLVVAGDGEGLVEMATLGLLTTGTTNPILYDASLTKAQRQNAAKQSPVLVLTDTNQRRYDTAGNLIASHGYVLTATEPAQTSSVGMQPNEPFGPGSPNSQTVALNSGVKDVYASSYGNPVTQNPEDAPYYALDANPSTAWQTSAFSNAIGQWIQIDATHPHRIHSLLVLQPQSPLQNRVITKIRLTLSDGFSRVFTLNPSSLQGGQTLAFPSQTTKSIRLTIEQTASDQPLALDTGVGFAEITAPGFAPVFHALRLPSNFLAHYKTAAAYGPLYIVMGRLRATPLPPRADPELQLSRVFSLPSARTFSLRGLASANPLASDLTIESIFGGLTGSGTFVERSDATTRLVGSLQTPSWNMFDGEPQTAWQSAFHAAETSKIQFSLNRAIHIDHLSLSYINDGRHSIPTEFSLASGDQLVTFNVPAAVAPASTPRNQVTTQLVHFPEIFGSEFTLSVVKTRILSVRDRVTNGVNKAPMGIAEISLPGVSPSHLAQQTLDTGCRSDLLSLDGAPIPVRVLGTLAQALNLQPLTIESCSGALTVARGRHAVVSSPGSQTGLNIDYLVWTSQGLGPVHPGISTSVNSKWVSRSAVSATVQPADAGRWIILGQSFSTGWHASINGEDLGPPTLIDGASNGWHLPSGLKANSTVTFEWQPQRTLSILLWISGLSLGVTVLLLWRRRRQAIDDDVTPTSAPVIDLRRLWRPDRSSYLLAVVIGLCVSVWFVPISVGAAWVLRRYSSLQRSTIALIAGLFLSGALVTALASHFVRPHDISWPERVPLANGLIWVALGLWFLAIILEEPTAAPVASSPAPVLAPPEPEPEQPSRRRGLNVPVAVETTQEEQLPDLHIAPVGLWRAIGLVRAMRTRRKDPQAYRRIMAVDGVNQAIGRVPLFNRTVLEIINGTESYAGVLIDRGARVARMSRDARPAGDPGYPEGIINEYDYTPLNIPVNDQMFDVVFATNALSGWERPDELLRELRRVVRIGGSLYIQNATRDRAKGDSANEDPRQTLTTTDVMRVVRRLEDVAIVTLAPQFGSTAMSWLTRLPLLRNVLVGNIVIVLERTK